MKVLLKQLSRKTSGQRFVPEIDGLRFFAIITVLIFHLNTAFSKAIGSPGAKGEGTSTLFELGWWIIRMDLGVKVFFAISGFILALPFLNQYWFDGRKIKIRDYLTRRLTRLEPPYILAIMMFFMVHVFVLDVPFQKYLGNFFASLGYVHNFIYCSGSVILPVAWSLEVEVQFYMLVPLIAMLVFKPKKHALGVILILLLLLVAIFSKNYIMSHQLKYIGLSILVYFSHFAVGILFGMIYLLHKDFILKKSVLWDLFGFVGVIALFYFYKPQVSISNNIFFNASIFILFLAVFKGQLTNYVYRQPVIFVTGGMCYSIYLIHFPLLLLLVKATKHLAVFESYYLNYGLQFIVLIPLVIVISAVYFKLFEQPFMDKHWPQKLKNGEFLQGFKRRRV